MCGRHNLSSTLWNYPQLRRELLNRVLGHLQRRSLYGLAGWFSREFHWRKASLKKGNWETGNRVRKDRYLPFRPRPPPPDSLVNRARGRQRTSRNVGEPNRFRIPIGGARGRPFCPQQQTRRGTFAKSALCQRRTQTALLIARKVTLSSQLRSSNDLRGIDRRCCRRPPTWAAV